MKGNAAIGPDAGRAKEVATSVGGIPGYFAGLPTEITCPYCGRTAPVQNGLAICPHCSVEIQPADFIDNAKKLAHILWRTAKQLVSLLEKEYGFGRQKTKRMIVVNDPELGLTYKENPEFSED